MTIPGQRANGATPTPDSSAGGTGAPDATPDTEWLTMAPENPGGSVAAIAVAVVGFPLAILMAFAIASALVAGSLQVIRWSWDTIGQALS